MKAHLLFRDLDLLDVAEPPNAEDLVQDLDLDRLLDAMAGKDELIRQVARAVLLNGLTEPQHIHYRLAVLDDCLREPARARELYDLAGEGIAAERSEFNAFFADRPEPLLDRSRRILLLFFQVLRKLRRLGDVAAVDFVSEGFIQFFAMLTTELDEGYFHEVDVHLKQLEFRNGLLLSARLGAGNQGIDYVLRQPREENRSFFNRTGLHKPTYSHTIPDRDDGGFQALSELRDRGLSEVANAVAQSTDHVLNFFRALRAELAFYIGCLNLHERLAGAGVAVCYPVAQPPGSARLSARGLFDVCLALRTSDPVIGNDLNADGKKLVMITGANQGGKSTFLRSVGLAHLMMSAGMFVAGTAFTASTRAGLFTHFKREEDATMASGKLDEELARMRDIAVRISPGALLLCNESFASTNEREGSEIAREVLRAMIDADVTVVFVTHLFDLAHGFYNESLHTALFLRAERGEDTHRTFRILVGEPLPTSYGRDLYARIFAGRSSDDAGQPGAAPALPAASGAER